jgi:hypothetical protein
VQFELNTTALGPCHVILRKIDRYLSIIIGAQPAVGGRVLAQALGAIVAQLMP